MAESAEGVFVFVGVGFKKGAGQGEKGWDGCF